MKHVFLVLSVIVMMTACTPAAPEPGAPQVPASQTAPQSPEPIATSLPSTPALLDELVDVGGYRLRMICTGEGTPAVVVDPALGDPALESGNWLSLRYAVEDTTRFCLYDRAGLGSSEPAPGQVRTSQDVVEDLHTLLTTAGIQGPYVLVGREFGGLNVRLYAGQYRQEVAGMVLVDPIHPDYWRETLAVLPTESPDEPDSWKARRGFFTELITETPESIDLGKSSGQVRAIGSLGDLPLVVLSMRPVWFSFSDYPPEVTAAMEQVWQDQQAELAGLSSNGAYVDATAATDQDKEIADAILMVVAAARK